MLLLIKLFTILLKAPGLLSPSFQPYRRQPTKFLCPWGFSRQEYWSGLPCPPQGDCLNPGIEPRSLALRVDSLPSEPPGKPKNTGVVSLSLLQGNFPTQELNWGLPHCWQILYQRSYQGSPSDWPGTLLIGSNLRISPLVWLRLCQIWIAVWGSSLLNFCFSSLSFHRCLIFIIWGVFLFNPVLPHFIFHGDYLCPIFSPPAPEISHALNFVSAFVSWRIQTDMVSYLKYPILFSTLANQEQS